MVGYTADGPSRDIVLRYMGEKDRIESEIRDANFILQTNNVGMHDPLVDDEGYPRQDIDVYKVRHARHQIICLQNDHKNIMKAIERGLAEVHADLIGPNGEGPSHSPTVGPNGEGPSHSPTVTNTNGNGAFYNQFTGSNVSNDIPVYQHAFATVGVVQEGSPAHAAGLMENDEILEFGSINYQNFADMSQVSNLVSHSVNCRIHVQVRRGRRLHNLILIPKPWAQPGLLGCHIQRT